MGTSWENVSSWYDSITAESGHFYHKEVIIPNLLDFLELEAFPSPSLLDLGCGQGILARALPSIDYVGIDLSPSLISQAKKYMKNKEFMVGDITKPLLLKKKFTHAVSILAMQNVEEPEKVVQETAKYLIDGGICVIVLNHPCFRIPRQSSWGIDEGKKLQYRRIDTYMSPLKIPISMTPSHGKQGKTTWSFHYPLSSYFHFFKKAHLSITDVAEWTSNKTSEGKNAKRENRAREEFPLFLTIKAKKLK